MPQGPIATQISGLTPALVAKPVNVDASGNMITVPAGNGLPGGAVQISGASGSVAASVAAATLAAATGKTNYLTGFTVTAGGATAGVNVSLTITGLKGGTLTYVYTAPTGATVAGPVLNVQLNTPIPASAANVAIVVSLPSLGTGNLAAAVVATGFQV